MGGGNWGKLLYYIFYMSECLTVFSKINIRRKKFFDLLDVNKMFKRGKFYLILFNNSNI